MAIISIISFLAILYGIAAIVTNYRKKNRVMPFGIPAILAGFALFITSSMVVKVGAQEVGVLITPSGVDEKELHTGLAFYRSVEQPGDDG